MMIINELRPGLLVQQTTTRGTDLYRVCTADDGRTTLQWVFTQLRGAEDHFPSRTAVFTFTAAEITKRVHGASTQMVNRFYDALDAGRAEGVADPELGVGVHGDALHADPPAAAPADGGPLERKLAGQTGFGCQFVDAVGSRIR